MLRTAVHTLPLTQNSVKWKIDVPPVRGRSVCFVCTSLFPFLSLSLYSGRKPAHCCGRRTSSSQTLCQSCRSSGSSHEMCTTIYATKMRLSLFKVSRSSAGAPFTCLRVDIAVIGEVISVRAAMLSTRSKDYFQTLVWLLFVQGPRLQCGLLNPFSDNNMCCFTGTQYVSHSTSGIQYIVVCDITCMSDCTCT